MGDYHEVVRDRNGKPYHKFQTGKYIKVVASRLMTFPANVLGITGVILFSAFIGYHYFQKYKNA